MSTEMRSRARLLLGCALVFGPFLIQPNPSATAGVMWVSLFAPVQRVLAAGGHHLGFALDDLAGWRRSGSENRRLRREAAELRARLARQIADSKDKDEKLRQLREFAPHRRGLTRHGAEVIGEGIGAQPGLVFIDRGSDSGIKPGMVVVVGHAIVGAVRAVAPRVSSVRLITSPGARVDSQIVATGEKGIVVGNGDGTMRMKYISKTRPEAGAEVVSRGRDGVTPKHFLMGVVTEVQWRPGQLTYDVTLRPATDLDRLVSVVVVKPSISIEDFPGDGADGGGSNE
jgi:rod shape-determining protein MreC